MPGEYISVRQASLEEVVRLSQLIPEFVDPHTLEEYQKRLGNKEHLVLVADYKKQPAGFKVGYDKYADGSFYSWMGGVIPTFRKKSVAQFLQQEQERWVKSKGYFRLRFKTRNHLKPMIFFGLKNGFSIVEVIKKSEVSQYRIILEKVL